MRALRALLPALLSIAACAPVSRPRAQPSGAPRTSSARGDNVVRLVRAPTDPSALRELDVALMRFSDLSRRHREMVHGGDPMPAPQIENWRELMDRLDGLVAPDNLEHARRVLEVELEWDSRAYCTLPAEVVDAALERMDRLAARLAERRQPKERRVERKVLRAPFAWPVAPVSVTSPFGTRLEPFTKTYAPHQGVDLVASRGQEVMAAGDGIVVRAEYGSGHGNHVDVEHLEGVMTRYSHLAVILVKPGAALRQGDVLGLAGETGRATGVHLHFEFWRNGQAIDPLDELGTPESSMPRASSSEVPARSAQAALVAAQDRDR
jgi:hypothetical protein